MEPLRLGGPVFVCCGVFVLQSVGCVADESGGEPPLASPEVGDACVPYGEDEASHAGHTIDRITLELQHPSCGEAMVCLLYGFQGRVSCPEGQAAGMASCTVPGSEQAVTAEVCGQCSLRPASDTVYCSCRCGPAAGQPEAASYCECPTGFDCAEIAPYFPGLDNQDAGRYCIKAGTIYDASDVDAVCGPVTGHVGPLCAGT